MEKYCAIENLETANPKLKGIKMKKFTVALRQVRELMWEVEAEDNFDAEFKTVSCDIKPDFIKVIESEIDIEEIDIEEIDIEME